MRCSAKLGEIQCAFESGHTGRHGAQADMAVVLSPEEVEHYVPAAGSFWAACHLHGPKPTLFPASEDGCPLCAMGKIEARA